MRKALVVPALAAAAALMFAGCAAPETPKQTLAASLTKTGQGKDLTTSIKLDATADDLKKLVAAMSEGTASSSDQQTIDLVTKIVPKLSIKTSMHSNGSDLNSVKDPAGVDASFAVLADGKPAEVLWVKSQAYIHADVEGIGQATGLFTVTQVKMLTDSMATSMPWINDVVDGKWVALDSATVSTYIDKAKAQLASASPSAAPSIDAAKASAAIMDASEITKVDDKTYKVVTDAKKFIKAIAAVDANDEMTDAKADETIAKLNDGANLDTTVTLTDGKVSKVVVDLADVLRTWAKPDAEQPVIAKLAAADFKLSGVLEIDGADPKLAAPSAASTIPASDLKGLLPA